MYKRIFHAVWMHMISFSHALVFYSVFYAIASRQQTQNVNMLHVNMMELMAENKEGKSWCSVHVFARLCLVVTVSRRLHTPHWYSILYPHICPQEARNTAMPPISTLAHLTPRQWVALCFRKSQIDWIDQCFLPQTSVAESPPLHPPPQPLYIQSTKRGNDLLR